MEVTHQTIPSISKFRQLNIWPVATAPGSETAPLSYFLCKAVTSKFVLSG
jgi:hypothetical protein